MRQTTHAILIERDGLRQQVDLRNHYMGESLKRTDLNADTIESSADDEDLFEMFLKRACNELTASVALRFPSVNCNIDKDYISFEFIIDGNARENIIPLLKQSVTDYLVNELIMQWLLLRMPGAAQSYISMRTLLHNNVQQQFAKLYGCSRIHRRATDLAGI